MREDQKQIPGQINELRQAMRNRIEQQAVEGKVIPDAIWSAIETLCGKGYKYIAMDRNGFTHVYQEKPIKGDHFWVDVSLDTETPAIRIPMLTDFFEDWETSLTEKPKKETGNTQAKGDDPAIVRIKQKFPELFITAHEK